MRHQEIPEVHSPGVLIGFTLGVGLVSSFAAVFYTSITGYFSFAAVNLILLILWTGITGYWASASVKWFHLEHSQNVKHLSLLGSSLGYISSWLTLVCLSDTPLGFINFISERYIQGVKISFGNVGMSEMVGSVKGIPLGLCWLLEAGFLLYFSLPTKDEEDDEDNHENKDDPMIDEIFG